jgi:hypothetical protein
MAHGSTDFTDWHGFFGLFSKIRVHPLHPCHPCSIQPGCWVDTLSAAKSNGTRIGRILRIGTDFLVYFLKSVLIRCIRVIRVPSNPVAE